MTTRREKEVICFASKTIGFNNSRDNWCFYNSYLFEANGFGGKAYYHMNVDYDDKTGEISNMLPNVSKSLGIVAVAYVQTAFDDGRLLHAKATIVTQFKGLSIDAIDYYIHGDAISENNQSTGAMQARMNGQLNFADKYLDGTGNIWGKIPNVIRIYRSFTSSNINIKIICSKMKAEVVLIFISNANYIRNFTPNISSPI